MRGSRRGAGCTLGLACLHGTVLRALYTRTSAARFLAPSTWPRLPRDGQAVVCAVLSCAERLYAAADDHTGLPRTGGDGADAGGVPWLPTELWLLILSFLRGYELGE